MFQHKECVLTELYIRGEVRTVGTDVNLSDLETNKRTDDLFLYSSVYVFSQFVTAKANCGLRTDFKIRFILFLSCKLNFNYLFFLRT